jgi:hypothetical protein
MTEDDVRQWAARENAEVERVPNSEETRTAATGYGGVFFPAQSMAAIEQHFEKLGATSDGEE